jgi:Zn-dependent M28 family amino/carboxypeptidase
MKGRRNGSPEMKEAAEWISSKFGEYGIKYLDGHDSFIFDYSYNSRSAEINERNIIGLIEGSDPDLKNEILVLSAHFDHTGIRKGLSADSINNGADDNAAGTSTLIGIAKYIKESGVKPGRTIVFAAFSGEEDGIRGSRNFVFNLPFEAQRIYTNMNFEMTGHSEELGKGKYYMTGCPFSNLDDIIKSYITEPYIQLIDTIPITNMLFNSSDNIAFSRISVKDGVATGIPSGTFATSTLARYIHTPSDEAELFDFDNMALIVNHLAEVALKLSKEKKKVEWTDPKFKRP